MSYSIEPYSDKYLDDVIEITRNFHAEAIKDYEQYIDESTFVDTVTKFRDQNARHSFLLVVDEKCQGVLSGFECKTTYNGKRVFQELVWYVNAPYRKYGVILLRKAEEFAKTEGFDAMVMSLLENSKSDKLKTFYNRMGFKPMETHFIKDLNGESRKTQPE